MEIRRELAETNRDAYIGDVAMTLENIALLRKTTDRKAEAKKTAEEALEIYKELAKNIPKYGKRMLKTPSDCSINFHNKFMTNIIKSGSSLKTSLLF